MLKCERIDNSDRTDINKSNKSKECSICHYWYLKDIGYKFEPYALIIVTIYQWWLMD